MGRFDALSVKDHVAVWNDTARLPSHLVAAGPVRRCPDSNRTISESSSATGSDTTAAPV
jgi:hypothetical protein